MTELIKTQEHFYTKDFGHYNQKEDNFVANQELTVTITLNEYRNLITETGKAKSKIEEAEKDKWRREEENRNLKEEVAKLKGLLYEKNVVKNNITQDDINGLSDEF